MKWLGLFPIGIHLVSAYLFFRIATIPAGYWRWWLGWGALGCGTAIYAWARIENTSNIVVHGQPFDMSRMIFASAGATGTCIFALCMWNIFRPRVRVPEPVAQIVMSWQGRILSWNEAAEALLGWTAAEAVGQELATLLIPEDLMISVGGQLVDARTLHRAGLQRYRETGESAIIDTRFDTVALHKDQRRIEVEVRVNVHQAAGVTTFLGQITPRLRPAL